MGGPIQFPNAANIPILGQQCTPLCCTIIVTIRCNCDAPQIFPIDGVNAAAMCPACRRVYKIADVNHSGVMNQGTVQIACVGVANQPVEAATESVSKPS